MKYSITESKLESTIYAYINDLFGNDLHFTAYEDEDGNEMDSALEFYLVTMGTKKMKRFVGTIVIILLVIV